MLQGRTLWELHREAGGRHARRVDGGRRGHAHPDLRRVLDGVRAGRGRPVHAPASAPATSCRWQLPDLDRVDGAGRGPEPARRHPEPDPAHLPRAGGRLLHPPGRGQAARRAVGVARASTSRPWPPASPRSRRRHAGAGRRTGRCPRATRRPCPRRRTRSTPTTPVRWLFYTSGTTADPKGAQHTDASIAAVAAGMGERLALIDRRPQRPGLPVHPHRRHHLAVHQPAVRVLATSCSRRFDPEQTAGGAGPGGRHPGRLGHRASTRRTWRPSEQPPSPIFPRRARLPRRRRAQAAERCVTR